MHRKSLICGGIRVTMMILIVQKVQIKETDKLEEFQEKR